VAFEFRISDFGFFSIPLLPGGGRKSWLERHAPGRRRNILLRRMDGRSGCSLTVASAYGLQPNAFKDWERIVKEKLLAKRRKVLIF
jgi:hypothetical protein